jgi:SAM-dependent methyltransferase
MAGVEPDGRTLVPEDAGRGHLAGSFDAIAAAYARHRPDYPDAALDVALPAAPAAVLDVGAGTGKLTAAALRRGHDVIAVEPLGGMRAELARGCPSATVLAGVAESIPLPDAAVDAVVVGQAFHWFDGPAALDEIARVTRIGGSVALLWNNEDATDPLVVALYAELAPLGRPPRGATGLGDDPVDDAAVRIDGATPDDERRPPFSGHPLLTEPELAAVRWTWRGTVDDLIGLTHTYSYVISAGDATRRRYDEAMRDPVVALRPGAKVIDVPVICRVWRLTRR